MIRYVKYQNKMNGSAAFGKWYLRAVASETIDVEMLSEHMSAHNTPFSKGTIKGILSDAITCIKELLLEGKAVKLEDLAIFRIGLICSGAEDRKDALPANVTGVRFNAMAVGDMSVTQLKREIHLKEQKHYDAGTETEEEDAGNEEQA